MPGPKTPTRMASLFRWSAFLLVASLCLTPTLAAAESSAAELEPGLDQQPREVRRLATGMMISAFVAQGISFGATVSTVADPYAINANGPVLWIVQGASIPFAPLGITGFALRFGGSSRAERLRWTGIGLLQAAAYSGLIGGISLAAAFAPGMGEEGLLLVPGVFGHLGATIGFLISGGVCVGAAKRPPTWRGLSGSGRPQGSAARWAVVVPTIAPRQGGLSLGLFGMF